MSYNQLTKEINKFKKKTLYYLQHVFLRHDFVSLQVISTHLNWTEMWWFEHVFVRDDMFEPWLETCLKASSRHAAYRFLCFLNLLTIRDDFLHVLCTKCSSTMTTVVKTFLGKTYIRVAIIKEFQISLVGIFISIHV